jgi:DNA-binding beta-propeller fold protein YncE
LNKPLAAASFAVILLSLGPAPSAAPAEPTQASKAVGMPSATPRIDVVPAAGAVFAGDAMRFHVRIVGGTTPPEGVRWQAFGAGSIDATGLYRAPASPGNAASIVATIEGSAGGARVSVVGPPPQGAVHAVVACFADGSLDIRGTHDEPVFGRLAIGDAAGGAAIDERSTFAVATSGEQLVAVDLATMTTRTSAPLPGARLGEVVLLDGGAFAAATNESADIGGQGVAVFRIRSNAAPQLVSTAPAGETPEGIAVDSDGRTMYVAAVNSNSVTRIVLSGDGHTRKTGYARTNTRPFGLAVDERDHLLLVADNDTPTLSGAQSRPGLEAFSLPSLQRHGLPRSTGSPDALPLGVAVDESAGRLFVTNEGDDDVAVFALPSLRREATLRVGRTPWLPSVDTRLHVLYVPNARDDTLDIFDTRTLGRVARDVSTCAYPVGVAVNASPPTN